MKIETLKEIIKKKLSNEQFAVLTNLSNGSSEIFKLGIPISKNFINYKNEIENYHNLKKNGIIDGSTGEDSDNEKLKRYKGNTDIISAANVICHIPDLTDLIKGVDYLLNADGLFIFEEPYLGSMYEKTSYDQIYDEHIYMFSASSVKKI